MMFVVVRDAAHATTATEIRDAAAASLPVAAATTKDIVCSIEASQHHGGRCRLGCGAPKCCVSEAPTLALRQHRRLMLARASISFAIGIKTMVSTS